MSTRTNRKRSQFSPATNNNNNKSNKKAKPTQFEYCGETFDLLESVAARHRDGTWYLASVVQILEDEVVITYHSGTHRGVRLSNESNKKGIAKIDAVACGDYGAQIPSTKRFKVQDIWMAAGQECTVIKVQHDSVSFTNPERQILELRGNDLIDQVDYCVYRAPEEEEQETKTSNKPAAIQIEVVEAGKKCGQCGLFYTLQSCIFCWIGTFLQQCQGTKRGIAIQDNKGGWYTGKVLLLDPGKGLKVHYDYFSARHDEWIKEYYNRTSVFLEEHFEKLPNGQRGDIRLKRRYATMYTRNDWNEIALDTHPNPSTLAVTSRAWPRALPTTPVREVDMEVYEVEKVLDRRVNDNGVEYFIKWKNYPDSENSWEPGTSLAGCPDLLAAFEQAHPMPALTVETDNNNNNYEPVSPAYHPVSPGSPCEHVLRYTFAPGPRWICVRCCERFNKADPPAAGIASDDVIWPPSNNNSTSTSSEPCCHYLQPDETIDGKKTWKCIRCEKKFPSESSDHKAAEVEPTSNNMLDEVLEQDLITEGPCKECKESPEVRLYDSIHTATQLCFACFSTIAQDGPRIHKVVYLKQQARSVKEILETPQKTSEERVEVTKDEYLSRVRHYQVTEVLPNHAIVQNLEAGSEWLCALDDPFFKTARSSVRTQHNNQRVNKTQIVDKLRACGADVFTICWDINLTKTDCKRFGTQHSQEIDVDALFQSLERTVTGTLASSRDKDPFGTTLIYDLSERQGDHFAFKTVTHRTIKWLIHNNVKYVAIA